MTLLKRKKIRREEEVKEFRYVGILLMLSPLAGAVGAAGAATAVC